MKRLHVVQAQAGDVDAFESLVRQHTPAVYRVCFSLVGADLASDMTQEAFVAAWRSLDRLGDPARFGAWIYRIAVNCCRTSLRRAPRIRDISLDLNARERARAVPTSARFEPQVELRATLMPALARLSFDHRTVLALHYAADLPIRDVARVLDIPEGTAKSRLNAALSQVRLALEEPDRG
ncbi:MAG: hypothetical protein QOH61_1652 [Chloroflexota bacterium]|nr:hypothetical protein [Chloroflexota bacterium]